MDIRTETQHLSDKTTLTEELAFFAKNLNKPVLIVAADVLSRDRSTYRIMDALGVNDAGTVVKTRKMWVFTSVDGVVLRTKSAGMVAIYAL